MFGDSVQYMSLHDNVDPLLCQFETYYNLFTLKVLNCWEISCCSLNPVIPFQFFLNYELLKCLCRVQLLQALHNLLML